MLNTPITEEDIDFIDSILEKYASEGSICNASELDGFLTAIVSGPDMIMPSEWMPAIWGGEDSSPEWESEDEMLRFIELAMNIMNNNAQTLIEQPDDFEPMYLMHIMDGEPVEIVSFWCGGYMLASLMRPQGWDDMPEEIDEHFGAIVLFGTEAGRVVCEELPKEAVDKQLQKIAPAVRAIHAHYLEQRADMRATQSPGFGNAPKAQVLPFVRSQPKIGPNQPCPCGSGKKYKKCCGRP